LGEWQSQQIYGLQNESQIKAHVARIHLHQKPSLSFPTYLVFVGIEFFSKDRCIMSIGDKVVSFKVITVNDDEKVIGVRAVTWPTEHENNGLLYDVQLKIAKLVG
jgi:hypothetical protein